MLAVSYTVMRAGSPETRAPLSGGVKYAIPAHDAETK